MKTTVRAGHVHFVRITIERRERLTLKINSPLEKTFGIEEKLRQNIVANFTIDEKRDTSFQLLQTTIVVAPSRRIRPSRNLNRHSSKRRYLQFQLIYL